MPTAIARRVPILTIGGFHEVNVELDGSLHQKIEKFEAIGTASQARSQNRVR